jgi:hypothetical protein
VREGGVPRSQDVSGVRVYSSLMSRTAYGFAFCLSEMVPALPFYSRKGTPGYMHVLRDIFPGKEDPRPLHLLCSWRRAAVGGVAHVKAQVWF